MRTALSLSLSVLLTLTALQAAPVCQQEPEAVAQQPVAQQPVAQQPAPKFVRFLDEGNHEGQLQTGIVTYENEDGVTIDLIAVIHMGDEAYYQKLQKDFEAYDALLYEITKPKGEKVSSLKVKNHPMRMMMRMQTKMMGLASQMEALDYDQPNFVHADLDMETFQRLCKEKGDSVMATMMKSQRSVMKAAGGKGQGGMPFMNPFGFGRGKRGTDPRQAMKYFQARQMHHLEATKEAHTAGQSGVGSVLLTERNKRCMEVVSERLDAGDKKLGIFYGAAHMPDFEQRLEKLGFKQSKNNWRTAWDIRAARQEDDSLDDEPAVEKKKAGKKRRRII
ncbi:MAG: hypothetical protein ACYTGW_04925 [Planctomycetota bacterium]|jgi:hypothetical protein